MNNYDPEPLAVIFMPFVSAMCPRDTTPWVGICLGRQKFGGGRRLIRWKKGMFLRIFFGDTDSVSSFSQFLYNNAIFD